MVKLLIPVLLIVAVLTSCSSLKPLNSAGNNQAVGRKTTNSTASSSSATAKPVRFLDDISASGSTDDKKETATVVVKNRNTERITEKTTPGGYGSRSSSIEKASPLQLKYAVLLNMEVEMLANDRLLEFVDEWYGTRYKMGGTTKKGIDCSAFVQAVYLSAFAISLPRTARDQYSSSRIISSTELKEGDLVFFNTRGGVSHVGIYLQNNKFIHASTSLGVTVSDMFDPYYMKHFIGAGRIERPAAQNE